jgi:hypothetical protein
MNRTWFFTPVTITLLSRANAAALQSARCVPPSLRAAASLRMSRSVPLLSAGTAGSSSRLTGQVGHRFGEGHVAALHHERGRISTDPAWVTRPLSLRRIDHERGIMVIMEWTAPVQPVAAPFPSRAKVARHHGGQVDRSFDLVPVNAIGRGHFPEG